MHAGVRGGDKWQRELLTGEVLPLSHSPEPEEKLLEAKRESLDNANNSTGRELQGLQIPPAPPTSPGAFMLPETFLLPSPTHFVLQDHQLTSFPSLTWHLKGHCHVMYVFNHDFGKNKALCALGAQEEWMMFL